MIIKKNELSIYDVEELHKELLQDFENGEIIIDMSPLDKLDMSVIQLFIAAKKSCDTSSKVFELTNANETVTQIFTNAGCLSLLGASHE